MIKLIVKGMSCGPCASNVTNAVHSVDSNAGVEVNLTTKLVEIESNSDVAQIAAAIEEAGYQVDRQAA